MNFKQQCKSMVVLACVMSGALLSGNGIAADQAAMAPKALAPVAQRADMVNVNTASAAELAEDIKGVGLAKAQAIVDFRELNGEFLQLEELTQVKGIGAATVEKNKSIIRFK